MGIFYSIQHNNHLRNTQHIVLLWYHRNAAEINVYEDIIKDGKENGKKRHEGAAGWGTGNSLFKQSWRAYKRR